MATALFRPVTLLLLTISLSGLGAAASPPVLGVMEKELARAKSELGKLDPAPYFLSYSISDHELISVAASQGALLNSTSLHVRYGAVHTRIGTAQLDNTHDESRGSGIESSLLPLGDDPDALSRVLWKVTHGKDAEPPWLKVQDTGRRHSADRDGD